MTLDISIIDYGLGNLSSIKSALDAVSVTSKFATSISDIVNSEALILPGVGSFEEAKLRLDNFKFTPAILEAVSEKKIPLLGICLGFQLLMSSSTEGSNTPGLNLLDHKVIRFPFTAEEKPGFKIPHIGFSSVDFSPASLLFSGLPQGSDFYFVHSYCVPYASEPPVKLDTCQSISSHGIKFVSSIELDNIFGVQFHPEKSQSNGLKLLANFSNYNSYA